LWRRWKNNGAFQFPSQRARRGESEREIPAKVEMILPQSGDGN
jgi:hypothetical protein